VEPGVITGMSTAVYPGIPRLLRDPAFSKQTRYLGAIWLYDNQIGELLFA